MTARAATPPFAVGLRTVSEVPTAVPLPVTGVLPPYLGCRTLYRNGPGRYEAEYADGAPYTVRHWFDAFALLHAFSIDAPANTVSYRSRFTSPGLPRAIATTCAARHAYYSFGSHDPCRSLLAKFFQLWTASVPVDPDTGKAPVTCCVTVQRVPGKGSVVARTDSATQAVIDPETLEVDHFFSFSELNANLSGPFSASHAHLDEETGDFINFNFDIRGPGPVVYKVFRITKDGDTEILAEFTDLPCYIHSFAVTENYVVLCLCPFHLNAIQLLLNKSILAGSKYNGDLPTKFAVISRSDRRVVARYESPSFFCFHTVNAFESDDAIHIDICKYKDDEILHQLSMDFMLNGTQFAPSCVSRFSLENLSTFDDSKEVGAARETVLHEETLELPRIHSSLLRKDYRFIYGAAYETLPEKVPYRRLFDTVAKVDVKTGARITWFAGENGTVGEPIFVEDPNSSDEDGGALLVVVLDADRQKSDMVVLDAKTMTEVARAFVPQVVPLGFHGQFKCA